MSLNNYISGNEAFGIQQFDDSILGDEGRTVMSIDPVQCEGIDFGAPDGLNLILEMMHHHSRKYVPRYSELSRYYNNHDDIIYEVKKKNGKADYRIPSNLAAYISDMICGYMFGKPLRYNSTNQVLNDKLQTFIKDNNDAHENRMLKTYLSVFGNAYELMYLGVNDDGEIAPKYSAIKPLNAFVVHSSDITGEALIGVRYYQGTSGDHIDIYTHNQIFKWQSSSTRSVDDMYQNTSWSYSSADYTLVDGYPKLHGYPSVPLIEYVNNMKRQGDFEPVIGAIRAFDKLISEVSNCIVDNVNPILLIRGNPQTGADETGDNSPEAVASSSKNAGVLVMGEGSNGSDPDAKYLIKQYDANGIKTQCDRLIDTIMRDTLTPDIRDTNFGSNTTGTAMRYKLEGLDNKITEMQSYYEEAVRLRFQLAASIWRLNNYSQTSQFAKDEVTNIDFKWDVNLPVDTASRVSEINAVVPHVSKQTIAEVLSPITGVNPSLEIKRLADENERDEDDDVDGDNDNEDNNDQNIESDD